MKNNKNIFWSFIVIWVIVIIGSIFLILNSKWELFWSSVVIFEIISLAIIRHTLFFES